MRLSLCYLGGSFDCTELITEKDKVWIGHLPWSPRNRPVSLLLYRYIVFIINDGLFIHCPACCTEANISLLSARASPLAMLACSPVHVVLSCI